MILFALITCLCLLVFRVCFQHVVSYVVVQSVPSIIDISFALVNWDKANQKDLDYYKNKLDTPLSKHPLDSLVGCN